MIFGLRKPLFFRCFHAFEPKRSNCPKQLSGKDLARPCSTRMQHLAVATSRRIKIHGDFHSWGGLMNLPNTLTIARIFFVPLLVAVLVQERIILHWNGAVITNDVVALIIFWVAAATDVLDGYLARRWGQVTTIGTLLDPDRGQAAGFGRADFAGAGARGSGMAGGAAGRQGIRRFRACAASRRWKATPSKRANWERPKPFSQVLAISLLMISIHHAWVCDMGESLALRRGVVFALVGGCVLQQILAQGRYPHQAAAPPGIADRRTAEKADCCWRERREALRNRRRAARADRARAAGSFDRNCGPSAVSLTTRTWPTGPAVPAFFRSAKSSEPPALPVTTFTCSAAEISFVSFGFSIPVKAVLPSALTSTQAGWCAVSDNLHRRAAYGRKRRRGWCNVRRRFCAVAAGLPVCEDAAARTMRKQCAQRMPEIYPDRPRRRARPAMRAKSVSHAPGDPCDMRIARRAGGVGSGTVASSCLGNSASNGSGSRCRVSAYCRTKFRVKTSPGRHG